jgi:hypothetical protein
MQPAIYASACQMRAIQRTFETGGDDANQFCVRHGMNPSLYNGITYRSSLEAVWCVFLELREIVAEYEPAVACPRFAIVLTDGEIALAEVKPYLSRSEWLADSETFFKITSALEERTTSPYALLLGTSAILPSCFTFTMVEGKPKFEPSDFGNDDDARYDWKQATVIVRRRKNEN